MKKPQDQNRTGEKGDPDELLGDLESIKELLDEEDTEAASEPSDVPLLDDMVHGAYTLDESESLLSATPALGGGRRGGRNADRRESRYLNEDLFDTLLGDRWKRSASDILTEARGAIEAHRNDWTPEDTDELNEALRVRIDETLTEWLKETVRSRMDELHAVLLETAEATISEKLTTLIEKRRAELEAELLHRPEQPEGPEGKSGH
jgi:hypothetical protein